MLSIDQSSSRRCTLIAWIVHPFAGFSRLADDSNTGQRVIYSPGNITKLLGEADAFRFFCVPR